MQTFVGCTVLYRFPYHVVLEMPDGSRVTVPVRAFHQDDSQILTLDADASIDSTFVPTEQHRVPPEIVNVPVEFIARVTAVPDSRAA